MATLAELVVEAPPAGEGRWVRTPHTRKLVVRIAVPITEVEAARWGTAEWSDSEWSEGAGVWGLSTWGESAWSSGLEWLYLTDRVRGLDYTRGGDPLEGRPAIGTAGISLANADHYLSRWNPLSTFPSRRYLSQGSTVQIGWHAEVNPGVWSWRPAWTGIVESVAEHVSELDADVWVDWQLAETLSALAEVNRLAQAEQGGGETPAQRVARLLNDAGWAYGYSTGTTPVSALGQSDTLQGTEMAANRLAEIYLLADSVGWDIWTDRDGSVVAASKAYTSLGVFPAQGGTEAALGEVYEGGTFGGTVGLGTTAFTVYAWSGPGPDVGQAPGAVTNRWTLAMIGGTEETASDDASIAEVGEHGSGRSDLILQSQAAVAALTGWMVDLTGPAVRATTLSTISLVWHQFTEPVIDGLDIHAQLHVYRAWHRWRDGVASPTVGPVAWECVVGAYTVHVVALGTDEANVVADLTLSVLAEVEG